MTQIVPATAFARPQQTAPSLLERLRRHLARTRAAFAGQRRLAEIQPETLRDTRLSAEELTGEASHDPALPFFMQAGFGRGDR